MKRVIVHTFKLGDVDDPEIYAAMPLLEWQRTEAGAWVMKRALEPPVWQRSWDVNTYGYRFTVIAKLKDSDHTFWTLKWGC